MPFFLAILSFNGSKKKIKFMLKLWLFRNEHHLVHLVKKVTFPGAENHHIVTLCLWSVSIAVLLGIHHPELGGAGRGTVFWKWEILGVGNFIRGMRRYLNFIWLGVPSIRHVGQRNCVSSEHAPIGIQYVLPFWHHIRLVLGWIGYFQVFKISSVLSNLTKSCWHYMNSQSYCFEDTMLDECT